MISAGRRACAARNSKNFRLRQVLAWEPSISLPKGIVPIFGRSKQVSKRSLKLTCNSYKYILGWSACLLETPPTPFDPRGKCASLHDILAPGTTHRPHASTSSVASGGFVYGSG